MNFSELFSFDFFFPSLLVGVAPNLSDLNGFSPSHEQGLINASGKAVANNGEVIHHWIFSSALPEWIQYILSFGAAAAVLMIVVGGVMIMLAGEDEEYKTRGIKTLIWAIAGLIIAVLSYTIVEIVNKVPFFGTSPETNLLVSEEGNVQNLARGDLRTYIIPEIIQMILQIMGTLALGLFLYAGGIMVIRNGDEERISKARKLIFYALIGILISVLAYVIIDAVLQVNFTTQN